MSRIILNLAMSLDGFIADPKGRFDWIKGDGDHSHDTDESFSYHEFLESVGTIVMGSKAFEDCPGETLEEFKDKKVIVATSRQIRCDESVELFSGDIVSRVLEIKNMSDMDIWLFGGSKLADPFIKEMVIDEYIIGIIPVILGSGIPLFLGGNPAIELHLEGLYVEDGITIIRYTTR